MSDDKVIPLRGSFKCPALEDSPNQSVIIFLEEVLRKARRGEVMGLTMTWIEGQGDIVFQIIEGSADSHKLVASVTGLFHEVNKRWVTQ